MTATDLTALVSPLGVVNSVRRALAPRGLSRVHVCIGDAGSGRPGRSAVPPAGEVGTGRVLDDPDLSHTVAIAEAAERYAGANLHTEPVRAVAADLPGRVLDTWRIPRCSPREYARPGCPVVPYRDDVPIRWVRGLDVHTGEPTWVPAVMVAYGLRAEPAERFVYQISTGYSVHPDPAQALLGGILEIVERDAVALTWLQKLPLPPLRPDTFTDDVRYLLAWGERRFLTTHLFEATTDLAVPTVYVLQIAPHDPTARQIIGAGTGHSLGDAARRALLEVLTLRDAYYSDEPPPTDYTAFRTVLDGARMMSRPNHAAAFRFLLDGLDTRVPTASAPDLPADPTAALRVVLGRLADAGMQVVAVDRTCRELASVGLTGVTVVIPDLQPMSLQPLAQFRAHPRLREAPARMGFPSLSEEEQNQWPQPFA